MAPFPFPQKNKEGKVPTCSFPILMCLWRIIKLAVYIVKILLFIRKVPFSSCKQKSTLDLIWWYISPKVYSILHLHHSSLDDRLIYIFYNSIMSIIIEVYQKHSVSQSIVSKLIIKKTGNTADLTDHKLIEHWICKKKHSCETNKWMFNRKPS